MNNPPHTAYDSQTDPVLNRPHSGRRFIVAILAALVIAGVIVWRRGNGETDQNAETAPELSASTVTTVEPKRPAAVRTVAEGDLPANLFLECGHFDANDTVAILSSAEDVFDLSRLRIGRELCFFFEDGEARAVRIEYDRDTERKVVVSRDGDAFTAQEEPIAYEVTQETAAGTIDNFFYVDAMDAGLSEATVLEVADLFAFDVDFTTDIRIGDSFVIVYEKRRRNGTDASDGRILAAKFVNAGTPFFAYRLETEGRGRYYDAEGRELERQFLKAPLSYRKITSGFTGARLHPITKTVTDHYQIRLRRPGRNPGRRLGTRDSVERRLGGWLGEHRPSDTRQRLYDALRPPERLRGGHPVQHRGGTRRGHRIRRLDRLVDGTTPRLRHAAQRQSRQPAHARPSERGATVRRGNGCLPGIPR